MKINLKPLSLILWFAVLFGMVTAVSATELRLKEITPDAENHLKIEFSVLSDEGELLSNLTATTREAIAGKIGTLYLFVPETRYELTEKNGSPLWEVPRYISTESYAFHMDENFAENIAKLDPETYSPDQKIHTIGSLGFEVPETKMTEDEIQFILRVRTDYIAERIAPAYIESAAYPCVPYLQYTNRALTGGGGCANDMGEIREKEVNYSVSEKIFTFTSDIYGSFKAADIAAVTMRLLNPLLSISIQDPETNETKGTAFAELPEIVLSIPVK